MSPNKNSVTAIENFSPFIGSSLTAAAMFDRDMRFIWASQRWISDFQLVGENLIGRSFYEVFPATPQKLKDVHQRCLGGASESGDEEAFLRADGKVIWLRWEIRPWFSPSNEIGGIVIYCEDLTERKLAQDKLRHMYMELENKVRERTQEIELQSLLVRKMAEGVCLICAVDKTIVFVNPKFEAMFGYGPGELIGQPSSIIDCPDDAQVTSKGAREIFEQIFESGEYSYESQYRRKDGSQLWCRTTNSMFHHPKFGPVFVAVHKDISAGKIQDAKLRLSEQRYRDTFELAADAIFEAGLDGRYIGVNRAACELIGYSQSELVGKTIADLLPEHEQQRIAPTLSAHASSDQIRVEEWTLKRKDGALVPVEVCSKTIPGGRLVAFVRDITERKRLDQQQQFLDETIKHLSDTFEYQERVQRVADALVPKLADICVVRIFENGALQFKAAAASDASCLEALKLASASSAAMNFPAEISQAIMAGKTVLIEDWPSSPAESALLSPLQRKFVDGLGIKSCLVVPLFALDKCIGTLSLSMTSSPRKFTPSDLNLVEQLAPRCASAIENARLYQEAKQAVDARESVLAVVSHDLKNPLAAIDLSAQLLLKPEISQDKVKEIAHRLQSSTQAMFHMLSDLLDFGKIAAGAFAIEPSPFEAHKSIATALEAAQPKAQEKELRLIVDVPRDLPQVLGEELRLTQVLWNLLGNAIKFTPPGGSVALSAIQEGAVLKFTVADSGPGIDPQDAPRIFERYWQAQPTKSQGAGLGLAIAKGIVEAQGGRIWLDTGHNQGCRFHFTIPLAVKPAFALESVKANGSSPTL